MTYWNEAPLVRLLFPFVGGIIAGLYIYLPVAGILTGIITTVALLWVVLKGLKWKYDSRWVFGITANAAFILAGWYTANSYCEIKSPGHFSNHTTRASTLLLRIEEQPHEKPAFIKAVTEVEGVYENNKERATKGKLMIYLPNDSTGRSLQYGDRILVSTAADTIQAPLNPFEFNYKQYLAYHNIYHQAFVKNGQWVKLSAYHGWWVKRCAYQLRDKLLAIFREHLSGNEYTVAASLIAGYVDDIDRDLITAYANTGVLHVLSVSGMHVAIIYIAISRLLAFADRKRATAIIKNTLVILFLWFYAAVTGFSPAVLRATFMLTLVITGKMLDRENNIYNTLAASALVLLFINPYLITDVGFQLSYLSLVGIVTLQPGIYKLLHVRYRLLDYAWELTSTSVAAQAAVLPLILYYFQRFPNYFIPANLVVIPLSTIAIYSGIGLLLLNAVPVVSTLAGKITWLSVKALNYCVFGFNALPGAVLSGLCLTLWQTILLYGAIVLLTIYFFLKHYRLLAASAIGFMLMLILGNYEAFQHQAQQKMIVYGIPKTTAIDCMDGSHSLIVSNNLHGNTDKDYTFHIAGNHSHSGISNIQFYKADTNITTAHTWVNKNYIQYGNKRMVIINQNFQRPVGLPPYPVPVDYLLLSENPKWHIAELKAFFHFNHVIADCSNSRYRLHKWQEEAAVLGIQYYNVAQQGAFIVEM